MKKVGIITIIDYNNYGNRLQNYASQEVIKSLGYECTTIINYPKNNEERSLLERLKGKSLSDIIGIVLNKLENKKIKKYIKEKESNLKLFSTEYINESTFTIYPDSIMGNLGDSFDCFIVGSDQVWNPNFRYASPIDFLTFAPEGKKVAFSPSFGVSKIPELYIEKYKKWIGDFDYLSVREDAGAKIIKELTGRDAQVLLDPTLMLDKEEWKRVAKPSSTKPKGNYVLTYFLGEISEDTRELFDYLAEVKNLEIVHLSSLEQKERYSIGVSEFIDFVDSASIFLTDSFHGAVFSILFEKPFIVFDRASRTPSMSSRIDTLLSKFDLLERRWDEIKNNKEKIFNVDYAHIPSILEAERNKTINYLKEALDVKDGK